MMSKLPLDRLLNMKILMLREVAAYDLSNSYGLDNVLYNLLKRVPSNLRLLGIAGELL